MSVRNYIILLGHSDFHAMMLIRIRSDTGLFGHVESGAGIIVTVPGPEISFLTNKAV